MGSPGEVVRSDTAVCLNAKPRRLQRRKENRVLPDLSWAIWSIRLRAAGDAAGPLDFGGIAPVSNGIWNPVRFSYLRGSEATDFGSALMRLAGGIWADNVSQLRSDRRRMTPLGAAFWNPLDTGAMP